MSKDRNFRSVILLRETECGASGSVLFQLVQTNWCEQALIFASTACDIELHSYHAMSFTQSLIAPAEGGGTGLNHLAVFLIVR